MLKHAAPGRLWTGWHAYVLLVGGVLLWSCGLPAWGGDGPALTGVPVVIPFDAAILAQWLNQLDSDSYEEREAASEQLNLMAGQLAWQEPMAAAIRGRLVAAETSFELRARLERLAARLPLVVTTPPDDISAEEVTGLIAGIGDDDYGTRVASTRRLEWLVENPKLACEVMSQLKPLMRERRAELSEVWEKVRGSWLMSDPAGWRLPEVDDASIARWADTLTLGTDGASGAELVEAESELVDLLARDAYVERVRDVVAQRLELAELSIDARQRLERVLDWTKPAMVAEFWQGKQHLGIQHLLVDVPSIPTGAPRASHFDRIDDHTAHCVSGNSLSPGDYPVGVAFPHPTAQSQGGHAFFHLVNLPTPRKRMAYEYEVQQDSYARLEELSERTFARMLAEKRPISNTELLIIDELDAGALSRFAGPYLAQIDDDLDFPAELMQVGQGQASRHGNLAIVLAATGTHEAIDGLVSAVRAKRFLPATPEAPLELGWVAALAIAARDTWPGVDEWLAGLLDEQQPLWMGEEAGELAATAGALLLNRHGIAPSSFGLEPADHRMLNDLDCPSYREGAPGSVARVKQWWAQRERDPASTTTALAK
jgi:hypothetical protein